MGHGLYKKFSLVTCPTAVVKYLRTVTQGKKFVLTHGLRVHHGGEGLAAKVAEVVRAGV